MVVPMISLRFDSLLHIFFKIIEYICHNRLVLWEELELESPP